MIKQLPKNTRVVIIGGGIVGCSTAYHLAKLGWNDVVLLERKLLGSGTTWAAAGLVTQLRQNRQMSNLVRYATELYSSLEAETGKATGYIKTGAIAICKSEDRHIEWLRASAMARSFNIEVEEISLMKAEQKVPELKLNGVRSTFYIPNDGQTNPEDTTQSLAKGARMRGVKIFENTKVTGLKIKNRVIEGVHTELGDINCEYVINCAGMWGRDVGKMAKASIPLHAAEHMHVVTAPISGMEKVFPSVRDFDGYTYFKSEGGGLLFGGFEPVAKPWGRDGIPKDFSFTSLQEDWDQFEIFMDCAFKRFPVIKEVEIRHLEVVPESFTPDTSFMIGEVPHIKGLFNNCGMNSVGIASAAGAGRACAQWLDQGYPEEELWPVDVRRYFPWQQNIKYLHDRSVEAVGVLYHHHYPNRQKTTARNIIKSPLHDRFVDAQACFSQVAGWERADWFALDGLDPIHKYDWKNPNWFESQALEHNSIRTGVGLYDLSSLGKFLVQGQDALEVLQFICSNNIDVPIGKVVYTPVLNERGGFESDLTVTRIGDDQYFIVTATGTTNRDYDYIKKRLPKDKIVTITDITHGYAMLAVMGPKSRDLLSILTNEDLSNKAFPFGTAKEIDIAYARPLALRISYVGELGWELYVPTNFALAMYDEIRKKGEAFNLKLVGMQAVNSLRLEVGYRHWESDITPDDTPFEAGLGFGVDLKKNFTGKEILIKQKTKGIKHKLVLFTFKNQDKTKLYSNEPIFRNNIWVGEITSGAYGYTLNCSVGMGYLTKPGGGIIDNDWIKSGEYEIEVEGKKIVANVHLNSPYDPKNLRIKM